MIWVIPSRAQPDARARSCVRMWRVTEPNMPNRANHSILPVCTTATGRFIAMIRYISFAHL